MTDSHSRPLPLYESIVFWGLALIVWFGCWAHAAHDVWAASSVFGAATALGLFFLFGRFHDGKSIRLPFVVPSAGLLAAFWISFFGSLGKRHGGGNNHDEALCESLTNEPRQYLADD